MTYDTIERLLNVKIEILKESLEEIVNMGDLSDHNGLEIEFVYPYLLKKMSISSRGKKIMRKIATAINKSSMEKHKMILPSYNLKIFPEIFRTFLTICSDIS